MTKFEEKALLRKWKLAEYHGGPPLTRKENTQLKEIDKKLMREFICDFLLMAVLPASVFAYMIHHGLGR